MLLNKIFFLGNDILDISEILLQLEMKLGKDWQILGRFLSVSDNELDDMEEKAHRMFCAWKNQQKLPTLYDLANAIYKINRTDLIKVMEKFSSTNFF